VSKPVLERGLEEAFRSKERKGARETDPSCSILGARHQNSRGEEHEVDFKESSQELQGKIRCTRCKMSGCPSFRTSEPRIMVVTEKREKKKKEKTRK
jgi:hypothetical protein